jgi:hypothetical protein
MTSSSDNILSQWEEFVTIFRGFLNGMYGDHLKTVTMNYASLRFDNLFVYRLLQNDANSVKNLDILTSHLKNVIMTGKYDRNVITTLVKWLRFAPFHKLICLLYEDDNPYEGDVTRFEKDITTPLWDELDKDGGGDVFMTLLMKSSEETMIGNEGKELNKSLNGPIDIMAIVKRNMLFLWVLLVSFHLIHYIFDIWDDKVRRNIFISQFGNQEPSLKEPYPTKYLPFIVQDTIQVTVQRPSKSYLYFNDFTHLLYYSINPFGLTNDDTTTKQRSSGVLSASRQTPQWNLVKMEKITESPNIRIISHLDKHKDEKEVLLKKILTVK